MGTTLLLCLGNDLLRDDGVAWEVATALETADDMPAGVQIRRSAVSGFYLLDELTGYQQAVVVDAIHTGVHRPGTVLSFPFEALLPRFRITPTYSGRGIPPRGVAPPSHIPDTLGRRALRSGRRAPDYRCRTSEPGQFGTDAGPSPHAVGLPTVVALGRQSGVPVPDRIHIVAIEVLDMETVAEGLTGVVRAAVPRAVAVVREELDRMSRPAHSRSLPGVVT